MLKSLVQVGRSTFSILILLNTLFIASSCFALELESTSGPGNVAVARILEERTEVSTFVSALRSSGHWGGIASSDSFTIFVPTNKALRDEGSAFLLEVVLNKPENKERLNDLIGLHISASKLTLDNKVGPSTVITGTGSCFKLKVVENSVRVGPEASVVQTLRATNGVIHFIDHLLWTPYEDETRCI